MADPGTIGAVFSIASGVMKFLGAGEQADAEKRAAAEQAAAAEQSKRISQMNAAAIEAETAEEARREAERASKEASKRVAAAAASGGMPTGSKAIVMEDQARIDKEYLDWLKKSGKSRANIERERGEYSKQLGMIESGATRAKSKQTRAAGLGELVSSAKPAVTQLWDRFG